MAFKYATLYRPVARYTIPTGIEWDYVEAPCASFLLHISRNRPELPLSTRQFGVISTSRALTPDELYQFEIVEVLR